MQQVTIFCDDGLENQVVGALEEAGVDGFLRCGDASGNRFTDPGSVPRLVTWSAVMLVVPGVPPEVAGRLVDRIRRIAVACGAEPCLRITVSELAQVV